MVFQGTAWGKTMKNLALFYTLFLLVCYTAQEWRWENCAFKKHGTAEWRKVVTAVHKNMLWTGFPTRESSEVYEFYHRV